MSNNNHTARPEAWEAMAQWAAARSDNPADCILELRARVERLEQAQQPATCPHIVSSDEGTSYCGLAQQLAQQQPDVADPGTELVRRVQDAIDHAPDLYEARAVILCIADWLHERTRYGAEVLRREVGR
jgi:hypothetical protein